MLRKLAAWALFSPARLGLVTLSGLVAVAAVVVVVHRPASAVAQFHAAPTHGGAGASAHVSAAKSPGRAWEATSSAVRARRVVRRFLAVYLRSSSKTATHVPTELGRLCTPDLWSGLRLADPSAMPVGPVVNLSQAAKGSYASEFTAKLAHGAALTVDVVAWSHGWRVSDVRLKGGSS